LLTNIERRIGGGAADRASTRRSIDLPNGYSARSLDAGDDRA